jgi:DNA-binding response OmpR family regulator
MGGPRILVIDDERALRETIAETLRMDGFDVQTAADGKAGLELIGRTPFDVVLSDLRMPEMDGRALYHEVRREHPHALDRFVFLSAQTRGPEYGSFLLETGAPILEKPFTLEQLRRVVDRMVDRRSGQPA